MKNYLWLVVIFSLVCHLADAAERPGLIDPALVTRPQLHQLKIKDIDKAALERNSKIQREFELQKEAISRETNVRSLQQKAESIAEQSKMDLEAASRQQAELEKEKAVLAELSATLEQQKAVIAGEKADLQTEVEKLEFREKIFSGSFAGLFITAVLSVLAAFRAGHSGKLENRKRELEIAKLERELGQHTNDPEK